MKLDTEGEFRAALNHLKSRLAEPQRTNGIRRMPAKVTPQQIEEALQRIEEGTYGICASCSLVMPKGELLMRPYAEVCGVCRSRQARAA